MADEVIHTRNRGASAVAWIALIVAILALILGWIAYNRTGEDLENQIQTQVRRLLQLLIHNFWSYRQSVAEAALFVKVNRPSKPATSAAMPTV